MINVYKCARTLYCPKFEPLSVVRTLPKTNIQNTTRRRGPLTCTGVAHFLWKKKWNEQSMLRKHKNVTKFHVCRCVPGASIVTFFFCPRFEFVLVPVSSPKSDRNCKIDAYLAYLHTPMRTHYHIFVRIIKQRRLREWSKCQCLGQHKLLEPAC